MWREGDGSELVFTDTLELDLGDVVPSMAGPKRPEGRIPLENIAPVSPARSKPTTRSPASFPTAMRSKAPTSISAMATWRLPPSPPAPTRPTRRF